MSTYPRIDRLSVSNFQSLSSADISLGAFTVIVGPSNTGKSALLRALRAVARNVSSPSSVKAGQSAFTAKVTFGNTAVSLERGKGHSVYRVTLPDESEEVFTKAGTKVPEEIQKILGLSEPDGPDLTFSTQIDPPFLLNQSGSVVAKTLGDLTNVSKLHAASKEANRRRLEASKTLKFRTEDAQSCALRLREEFGDLQSHSTALKAARASMDAVQGKGRELERLKSVLAQIEMSEAAELDLRVRLEELPQPADVESLAESAGALLGERHALLDVIDTLAKLAQAEDTLQQGMQQAEDARHHYEQEYVSILQEAGTCPTCERAI